MGAHAGTQFDLTVVDALRAVLGRERPQRPSAPLGRRALAIASASLGGL
jgi:hypothetical protein